METISEKDQMVDLLDFKSTVLKMLEELKDVDKVRKTMSGTTI